MQIYYSNIDKYYLNSSLTKREKERSLGQKIIFDISKSVYNIDDEIVYDGKRPHFRNNEIYFSISHSENIIVVAFDTEPVGIDIEFVRQRNFEKLAKRYNIRINEPPDFYMWWTAYEAKYKNPSGKFVSTFEILPEYICSLSVERETDFTDIHIKKYR